MTLFRGTTQGRLGNNDIEVYPITLMIGVSLGNATVTLHTHALRII